MSEFRGVRIEQESGRARRWRERRRVGPHVTYDDVPLPLFPRAAELSPRGYDWGPGAMRAAEYALAWAILAAALDDPEAAEQLYEVFFWRVVSGFSARGWRLDDDGVRRWARLKLKQGGADRRRGTAAHHQLPVTDH